MARYRAGAIGRTGQGNWGHGLDTAFVGLPEVDFVAVADDDPEGLRDAGARTGARSLYADYRGMLERERLDFVAVCPRWLGARTEMVIAAAEAGVKGLFCEKPFARTLAEADAMLEACERAGRGWRWRTGGRTRMSSGPRRWSRKGLSESCSRSAARGSATIVPGRRT